MLASDLGAAVASTAIAATAVSTAFTATVAGRPCVFRWPDGWYVGQ